LDAVISAVVEVEGLHVGDVLVAYVAALARARDMRSDRLQKGVEVKRDVIDPVKTDGQLPSVALSRLRELRVSSLRKHEKTTS
jgi:hypothetical protein